jgi:AcrR family transcriptional regulator
MKEEKRIISIHVDAIYPLTEARLPPKRSLSIQLDNSYPLWYAPDMTTTTDKPLRKDAERNRRLILDAAMELFAQRGLGVTLNEIAHHAGVGVGTVYRRFPDKEKLIDELFEEKVAELVAVIERAAADPDPWNGIVSFFTEANELQARDFALRDIILNAPDGLARSCRTRDRLMPAGARLIRRAQEAGKLRADIGSTDIAIIQLMLSAVIEASRDVEPNLWRRYVDIIIQGLRADPEPPGPLAQPALDQDTVQKVMSTGKKLTRR